MNEQMELFNEGGLRDEGGTVEPESGNEVPSGALKKEVADDIPVMISEGEFVFPADVVRYIGLNTLMKMRQDAKQGLKTMEKMGQMGNSEEAEIPDDVPFEMADLIVVSGKMKKEDDKKEEKAKGGTVGLQTGGTLMDDPRFQRPEDGTGGTPVLSDEDKEEIEDALSGTVFGTITMRRYVNADGVVKYIPFINDEPQMKIPEGFELDNTAPAPKSNIVSSAGDTDRGDDSGGGAFTPDRSSSFDNQGSASFDINNLSNEDLVEYYGSFSSPMNRFLTVGVGALFGGVPALGIAAMQQLAQTKGPNSLVAVEDLIAQKISRGEISGDLLDRLKELQQRAKEKGTSPKGFLASLIGKVSGGDEAKKRNLEKAIADGNVGAVNSNLTEVDRENFKVIDVSPTEAVPSKFVEEVETDVFGPDITAEDQPEADSFGEIPSSVDEFIDPAPAEVENLERIGAMSSYRDQLPDLSPSQVTPFRAMDEFAPVGEGKPERVNEIIMEMQKANEIGTPAYSLAGSPYETEGRRQLGTKTEDMPLKARTKKRTKKLDQPRTDIISRRGEKLSDTPSLFGQTRVDDFLLGVQRDDKGNISNLSEQQQKNIQKNVQDVRKADKVRQDTFMRTGDAIAADQAFHESFTGFDSAGNFTGATDPGTQAMQSVPSFGASNVYKEGGLSKMYVGGVPTKPMKPQRLKKGGLAKPKVKPKRMKKGGLASKKK